METINATVAARSLGSLLDRVLEGESFTITRQGRPIAVMERRAYLPESVLVERPPAAEPSQAPGDPR